MRICPTPVVESNLYTMGVASERDPRQTIPSEPLIPSAEVRLLRARLILEEALETIEALGFAIWVPNQGGDGVYATNGNFQIEEAVGAPSPEVWAASKEHLLEDIVDGCCDSIYVAVGTMLACGVDPDRHLEHVCFCNNAKFPNGEAITDANGKFQKPLGWTPPDHVKRFAEFDDMAAMSKAVIDYFKNQEAVPPSTSPRNPKIDETTEPFRYVDIQPPVAVGVAKEPEIYNRPECPFVYCDGKDGEPCKTENACRHRRSTEAG